METFKKLLLTSRPISWINTAYPFAASYLLISGRVDWIFIIGSVFFLIPYNLLMYGINDVFDYESDMRNPRKKGLEGIVLGKQFHQTTIITSVLTAIPFILFLLTVGGLVENLILLFIIFMVVAYSYRGLRFKELPFLDSFTSATHFVGPMIYGLALAGWSSEFLPYVLSFYAWGIASHAYGSVQDIVPDRHAGITSIGTYLSAKNTVILSATFYLIASVLLITRGIPSVFVGITGLMYAFNVLPFLKLKDETSGNANKGWQRFLILNYVTGFVITMVLITSFWL